MSSFYTSVDRIGQYMHVRGYENGRPFMKRFDYSPTLFVPCKEETGYVDIYGVPQMPMKFHNMYEASTYVKEMKQVSNGVVNGMDNYVLSFISDQYFGKQTEDISKVRVRTIDIEVHSAIYKDPNDPTTAVPDGFPDPAVARWPVDAITMYDNIDDTFYVYSTRHWSPEEDEFLSEETLKKVKFRFAESERNLLVDFLSDWGNNYADIVSGWFSNSFDIPYLYKRIQLTIGPSAADSLGPYGKTEIKILQDNNNGGRSFIKLIGMAQLDYIELYKKFTYVNRASYKLDDICLVELGEQKLDYSEEGNLVQLAIRSPVKYVSYNIKDVDLVKRLNERLLLIDLAMYSAYDAGLNFEDVYSPIKQWDSIIFNHLKKEKRVIPMRRYAASQPFDGAFVKEPIVGFHESLISFDYESLYPGIIRQVNISPETFVDLHYSNPTMDYFNKTIDLSGEKYSIAANGARYRRDVRGVVPIVVEKVFNDRKSFRVIQKAGAKLAADIDRERANPGSVPELAGKSQEELTQMRAKAVSEEIKYNLLQMAAKIAINSCYGALGNAHFRYFSLANAEAVTRTGQAIIQWTERKFNDHLNSVIGVKKDRVVAIDTDSCYVSFEDFTNKYLPNKSVDERVEILNQYCEQKIQPLINSWCKELCEYMNHVNSVMYMKRECIADTAFFVAKKRYALNVRDLEGARFAIPEIKIIGLETQRSSTPKLAQEGLLESIRIILQEDEETLQDYFSTFEESYMKADYREISAVSSANNLAKYSNDQLMPLKGCPGHIKGVLAYNRVARGIPGLDPIKEGEKVALIELREPNKLSSQNFAYPSGGMIPREMDTEMILSYMDRDLMFDKAYVAPLKKICDAIKWRCSVENSLDSFFM